MILAMIPTVAALVSVGCGGDDSMAVGVDAGARDDAARADDAAVALDAGPAGDPLDAVGLLYGVRSTGVSAPICTGTLIGPRTVLTAAHCVRPTGAPADIIDTAEVFFAVGPDSAHPDQTIQAVSAARTTVTGHDIGVYQLAEAPVGIEPIAVADTPLTDADIGTMLTAGGYGVRDADDTWADFLTRRMGELAVTTFEPQALHELFPTFAEFETFMETNARREFTTAQAQQIYDHAILRANDVFVGSPTSELQLKYLDSGGPGLDMFEGRFRVRAVHSRSYTANPTIAATGHASDLLPAGSAFAMLGVPVTQELIETALADGL